MRRDKIVALLAARNEAPRIGFCLRALACYADQIVLLDDASEDATVAVAESLAAESRIARILRKPRWEPDEAGDRNALLAAGRELGGTHFLLLDADEAFSANCRERDFLRGRVLALRPGDGLDMTWIQLWRSTEVHRFDDSVWTWRTILAAFCDDGRARFVPGTRTPRRPVDLCGARRELPGHLHGVLHFQFVHWRNLLVKQAWYRCLERLRHPAKPAREIDARYAPATDESDLRVRAARPEWLAGYPFFDPRPLAEPERWREAQVLDWFARHGREPFRDLDVWGVDWGGDGSAIPLAPPAPEDEARLAAELAARADALLRRAEATRGAGDLGAARAALSEALRLAPDRLDASLALAELLLDLGRRAPARWELERAAALHPDAEAPRARLSRATGSRERAARRTGGPRALLGRAAAALRRGSPAAAGHVRRGEGLAEAADAVALTLLSGRRLSLLRRTLASLPEPLLERAWVALLVNGDDPETEAFARTLRFVDRLLVEPGDVLPIGPALSRLVREIPASRRFHLHLEDDWECRADGGGWLGEAEAILDAEPSIGQVRLRHAKQRVRTRHMVTAKPIAWEKRTLTGVRCRVAPAHFTFNPSLVRTRDLPRIFPCTDEYHAQRRFHGPRLALRRPRVAQLVPGVFHHIGEGRSLRMALGRDPLPAHLRETTRPAER